MDSIYLLCWLTSLLTSTHTVAAATGDQLKALRTTLFTTNNYQTDIRPSSNQSEKMIVYMEIYLMGINSLDVVAQKMTTTAYLNLYWDDKFLTWDPSTNNDIQYIYVPQNKIWRPDLSLQNGFTKLKEFGDNFLLTTVYSDGTVYWKPFEIFETKCSISIKYFPFDKQTCTLEFGAWMTSLEDVDVELGQKGFILDEYQKSDEWTIVSTSGQAVESKSDGAKVIFTITVKRIPNYYILNIILPVLFLSILLNFAFVLPADSGEKIGYTMTVYLSFAVFLTIVSSSFPVTSSSSIMSTYLIFLLSVGTIIVMLTVLELRIHHRSSERPIPRIAQLLVKICRKLQCHKNSFNMIKPAEVPKSQTSDDKQTENKTLETECAENDCITWTDVTSAIDFTCFFLFFLLIGIATTVLMVMASTAQN